MTTTHGRTRGGRNSRFRLLGGKGAYTELRVLHRRAEEMQSPAEHVMDGAHVGTAALGNNCFLKSRRRMFSQIGSSLLNARIKAPSFSLQERSGVAMKAVVRKSKDLNGRAAQHVLLDGPPQPGRHRRHDSFRQQDRIGRAVADLGNRQAAGANGRPGSTLCPGLVAKTPAPQGPEVPSVALPYMSPEPVQAR